MTMALGGGGGQKCEFARSVVVCVFLQCSTLLEERYQTQI